VKFILSKHGFSLAAPGSAAWTFKRELTTNDLQPTATVQISEGEGKKIRGVDRRT